MVNTVKTHEHNCNESLREIKATPDARYHFRDSGLPNVYLAGIRYFVCGVCKKIVKVEIPAIEELMGAIASAIVTKTSPMAGVEVQFLRKRLGIKATDFAAMIDASPEQLSRWENGHNALSGSMDRYIRIAYTFISRDERLRALMEKVKHQFVQWSTSIHGAGANECIFAERLHNQKWRAEAAPVAA
jgi:DNA-binding transcriptional regulator YiaG